MQTFIQFRVISYQVTISTCMVIKFYHVLVIFNFGSYIKRVIVAEVLCYNIHTYKQHHTSKQN